MHKIDYVIDHFYTDAPDTLESRWTIDSEIVQVVPRSQVQDRLEKLS